MIKPVLSHMQTKKAQISLCICAVWLAPLFLTVIVSIGFVSKISRLSLASVAEQDGSSLTWLQTTEDRFFHDMAHQ